MCFIAIDDEVKSHELNDKSSDDEFNDEFHDLSYEKLLNDFNDLNRNYEKLIFKNSAPKKKISSFPKELEDSSKEKEITLTCDTRDSLKNENTSLNEKILDLTKIFHKFTNGKKNFDLMLGGKKCVFDKGGIGYKPFLKIKYLKNYFVNTSSLNDSKYVCNYCNQNGHTSFSCSIKKDAYFGVKQE